MRRLTSVVLPGAVRADQPDDLVAVQLEDDALAAACTPVERAETAGGPEGVSGPPTVLRVVVLQSCKTSLDLRDDLRGDDADDACRCCSGSSMTRYCRPNTVWSVGEKLTRPDSVGTFLNFSICAASAAPFVVPPALLDRGDDAVDRGRARDERRPVPRLAAPWRAC